MMELNKNQLQLLPALINRTCNLYHEIDAKIHYTSFCRHCSQQHGLCCWVAHTTTMEEKNTLIDIRDSLKDVQDMLLFLQKSESRGKINENAAVNRLEASRILLIEKISQYPEQGAWRGKLKVLEELNEWLGKGNTGETTAFTWKSKNREERLERKNLGNNVGRFRHVVSRLGNLFRSPWKWFSATKKAIKLLIVSTIITISSVRFCRKSRQYFFRPNRHDFLLSPMDAKMPITKLNFGKNINVFSGRG